jgi:hypothetical protein
MSCGVLQRCISYASEPLSLRAPSIAPDVCEGGSEAAAGGEKRDAAGQLVDTSVGSQFKINARSTMSRSGGYKERQSRANGMDERNGGVPEYKRRGDVIRLQRDSAACGGSIVLGGRKGFM